MFVCVYLCVCAFTNKFVYLCPFTHYTFIHFNSIYAHCIERRGDGDVLGVLLGGGWSTMVYICYAIGYIDIHTIL